MGASILGIGLTQRRASISSTVKQGSITKITEWGETLAFAQKCGSDCSSVGLRSNDHLKLGIIGIGVIFASLGLGEAVYRFAFLDFDGATDRLPIEMLFGLSFAWVATRLAGKLYQQYKRTSDRMNFIRDRTYRIRRAVEAIKLVPYPSDHQAIRVIREEVDRIEGALTEIAAR